MDSRTVVNVPIPAERAWEWRNQLDWHLQSFCADGSTTPEQLLDEVTAKKRQMWVGMRGPEPVVVVLTEVGPDLLQTLRFTHAAGKDRKAWLHLWQDIEDWAKSIGCKRIEAVARPGWERVLKDMTKTHVILEKRL